MGEEGGGGKAGGAGGEVRGSRGGGQGGGPTGGGGQGGGPTQAAAALHGPNELHGSDKTLLPPGDFNEVVDPERERERESYARRLVRRPPAWG